LIIIVVFVVVIIVLAFLARALFGRVGGLGGRRCGLLRGGIALLVFVLVIILVDTRAGLADRLGSSLCGCVGCLGSRLGRSGCIVVQRQWFGCCGAGAWI
jgi:hypothetical protein